MNKEPREHALDKSRQILEGPRRLSEEGRNLTWIVTEDRSGRGTFGTVLRIGLLEEVNTAGEFDVPEFVLTKRELLVLAEYWLKKQLDVYFSCFYYCDTGSEEVSTLNLAAH